MRSIYLNKWTQKIHKRKKRGGRVSISDENLLRIIKELVRRMKRKKHVKESVKRIENILGDVSIKIDLMGVPEINFILTVKKGRLNILTKRGYANVGIAFHKSFFFNFIKNPPKHNQAQVLLNNMVIRKGEVKILQALGVLFLGSLIQGLCSDFIKARREIAKTKTR